MPVAPFALTFPGKVVLIHTPRQYRMSTDLFGEGIFTGKGIYDLDAFYRVLDEAIPDNSI